MKRKQLLFAMATSVVFLVCLVGCSRGRSLEVEDMSPQAFRTCQDIKALDFSDVADMGGLWACAERVKSGVSSVTNKRELLSLERKIEKTINGISYENMDSSRCRLAYSLVAALFSVAQDAAYRAGGGREAALEVWFREIEHFNGEILRCKSEFGKCAARNDVLEMEGFRGRIEGCETEKSKTLYRIDFENHLAEIYCREHPEKKAQLMQRVKDTIGRHPEWYIRERSAAKSDVK